MGDQEKSLSQETSPARRGALSLGSCITIIAPFDIGVSYVFYAKPKRGKNHRHDNLRDDDSSLPTKDEISADWKSIFSGKVEWDTSPLPDHFNNPLGQIACQRLPSDEPPFKEALEKLPWIEEKGVSVEALFLPFGIGAFVVRGNLKGKPAAALESYWSKGDREIFRDNFGELVNSAANQFRRILDAEACKRNATVHKIKDISDLRNKTIYKAAYSYPIVFTDQAREYCEIREKILSREGSRENANKQGHIYSDGGESTLLCVGWQDACVQGVNQKLRQNIEHNFVISMVSWYALTVMNKVASAYLLNAFVDLANGKRRTISKKSRTIRLTFMDTANAAHPIRWATKPEDIALLECIHAAWSSKRLWENIDERTQMLATHHDELEAEENQREQKRLSMFALAIACLTLASAVADITQLLPEVKWLEDNDWWISILVPVVIGIVVYIYFNKEKLDEELEAADEFEYLPSWNVIRYE